MKLRSRGGRVSSATRGPRHLRSLRNTEPISPHILFPIPSGIWYVLAQVTLKFEEHTVDHKLQVRAEKEAAGYDREAYEHYCQSLRSVSHQKRPAAATEKPKRLEKFILKLAGPLNSVEAIEAAGCLSEEDRKVSAVRGTDDLGHPTDDFCVVSSSTKERILSWIDTTKSSFKPILVRYSQAEKAISSTSHCPTLGIDTSLPQHRLNLGEKPSPAQDEYPVWYFLYGTLTDPVILTRLIGGNESETASQYRPAKIQRGRVTTWGGKYNALVGAPANSPPVQGSAFLVKTPAQEDALRCYETDKYEVARCEIEMLDDGTAVKGLTFRFVGGD